MGAIPDGEAKAGGVDVGERAAAGMLALRAGDHFDDVVDHECSGDPLPVGEFEPDSGCGVRPVDAKVPSLTPFTYDDPARFRADSPPAPTSRRWTRDFDEVRIYGRFDSSVRTAEQTDIALFRSESSYTRWNRDLTTLAADRHLGVLETARLFAMVHTAVADTVIGGFAAKYVYRAWRPGRQSPRAAEEGNPETAPIRHGSRCSASTAPSTRRAMPSGTGR